jgi:hypothetical protein
MPDSRELVLKPNLSETLCSSPSPDRVQSANTAAKRFPPHPLPPENGCFCGKKAHIKSF